ncbi:hypothetical protein MNBD_GAMMA10-2827 [hydrothermal vent metagenome]|uniref:HipA-like C-terminal domain-containing protein n=1 Tax=hydrothermal vent metagenome TaxID=652676 RepID=A0A3B0Y6C1_9ZZZZ
MVLLDTDMLIVHAWFNGQYVPAGKLRIIGRSAEFWYGDSFLSKGYALDPIRLPLTQQVFHADGLQGDLGVLGDALPDGWGRYLIKRQFERGLSDLELLYVDSSKQRMGALYFSKGLDDKPEDNVHTLDWMMQFSDWLNGSNPSFPDKMEYGSSVGGAKPKCLVNTSDTEWIVKFQRANEPDNTPAIERGTLLLAKACQISVSDSRLIALPDAKTAILVKRFDRDNKQPLHYISAQTLCNVLMNDRGQALNDTRSYLVLADALSKFSSQARCDRLDLFKRIVFNILVNNHDDHVKNHGALRSIKGDWALSPAFDLVAGEGSSRDLAMEIGPEGYRATLDNLMHSVSTFGLTKKQGVDEVMKMLKTIKKWKLIFSDAGVDDKTINDIAWAIQDDIDVSGL